MPFLPALLLAVLLGTAFCHRTAAAEDAPPPLVLAGEAPSFALRGHLARLDDTDGLRGIGDVAHSNAFRVRPPDADERNYTSGAIWYRFTVVRTPEMPAEWLLTIGEPFIEDIRIFTPTGDGGFRETRLGRLIPNDRLPLASRQHVARIDLAQTTPTTVYVRLASRNEIQFMAQLWRPETVLFPEARLSMILGMLLSISIAIVAVYLMFGIWLRDATMLAYAFYVATIALMSACHTGTLALLFPAMGGNSNHLLSGFGVAGNLAALTVMWDRVLDLRTMFPRIHRLYRFVCAIALLFLFAVPTPWFPALIQPSFLITPVVTLTSLTLAIIRLRRGNSGYLVKYYILAFAPFLVFSLFHAAEALFPSQVDILSVRYIGNAAMLTHITILCVALGHRIALIQQGRLRADAEVSATRAAMHAHNNFVSMLSHQLRTPMAIILTSVGLLELDQPGNPRTARIRGAVRQMRDLTTDILADARMTEAAETMAVEPIELLPVLVSLLEGRRDGAARVFRQNFDVAAGVIVDGDRTLLGVMFANLIDNAIKYSPPGSEIRIDVTCAHGAVAVTIADDGPGIAPGEADRVFERFYRSPAASSYPGTGLGLYLVRQIAHRHDGSVSLASEPARGTALTVTLPLHRDPQKPKPARLHRPHLIPRFYRGTSDATSL
ncbi:MAG: sensor histidine kinase [Azospirillaceae bacterium]|nr:sensor histidine kinase [Azospirillaceae bacterium]